VPHISVPPTRSNLIRLRQELQFAREGYEILDRKREVLTSELLRIAHDAEALQEQVGHLFEAAYRSLAEARLTLGQERVEWAALAVKKSAEVELKHRGVMGISLPQLRPSGAPRGMPFSLGNTHAALDKAENAFRDVLNRIPELTELTNSVWVLAGELRKTLRRVNALEYIFIPEYERTITFIEGVLEEHEREEIFRLKQLKRRTVHPAAGPPES
jgi:V/A-type H+-transporting ATPase subunit D